MSAHVEPRTPESYMPAAPKVCCEHWCGQGEDGWPECCLCSDNPCDSVTVEKALDHGSYDRWQGQRDGIFLARQALSDEIAEAVPDIDPVWHTPEDAALVDGLSAAYTIVRGDVDEPPF